MSKPRGMSEIELEGIDPEEAFAVLGNEIRLDIVRTLWEAGAVREYEEIIDVADAMTFTDLRRAVEVSDNGKFNYHLSRLTPQFVRSTEDGYRLSGAGKRIARTVIAVSGTEQVEFGTELDRDCPLCGGGLLVGYDDGWMRVECTECDGLFGDDAPTGTVYLAEYPAAGATERSPDEALSAGIYRCLMDLTYLMQGVCRECIGPVSATLSACERHGSGCDCGSPFPAWVDHRCESCGFAKRLPLGLSVLGVTPVVAFLEHDGIDVLAPSFEKIVALLDERVSTDVHPDGADVTVSADHGTITVSLDTDCSVVSVERDLV